MPRADIEPFFVAPGSGHSSRRLLLISYHFPPEQTVGSLRWQKLAKHAAERGYGLDVLTVDPRSLANPDPTRLHELPAGTRVFGIAEPPLPLTSLARSAAAVLRRLRSLPGPRGTSSTAIAAGERERDPLPGSFTKEEVRWRPFSTRQLVRAGFAAEDHLRFGIWARRAAHLGERLAALRAYDVVVSCGPPHMTHEGARRLSRRTGLPFVMDLRDPWSLWQRLPEPIASPLWFRLAGRYEPRAIARAALVVMNTRPARDAMRRRYPEAADRIIAVMNGYDEDPLPAVRPSGRFTIAHAGSIYIDRDPSLLLRGAARVVRELRIGPDALGIELMGDVGSFSERIEEVVGEEGITDYVRIHPSRPRQEALEFLAGATLLVVLPQDSDLAIPSKLFEYMQFDAWILALAHRGSAIEVTARDAGIDVVAPDDLAAISATLRERYLEYARGVRPARGGRREQFSRRAQAQLLFDAIEARLGLGPTVPLPEPCAPSPRSAGASEFRSPPSRR